MFDQLRDVDAILRSGDVRLIHAGMPKTGTTVLQRTAARRRELLLDYGVHYPGATINHRKVMFAYAGRPTGWKGLSSTVPDRARWLALRAELQPGDARAVWLSNENLSEESEETLRGLLDEVGGASTVVLTMRSLPAQLASAWQQYLKSGVCVTFETWLQRVMGEPVDPRTTPSFGVRIDLAGVVDKWVRLVGPDRVVVVVLDPADRGLVPRTFERLLGLPDATLSADVRDRGANRSMSHPEAELVRQVNTVLRRVDDVTWRDYERYVRDGMVASMLSGRRPGASEQPIVPPTWAVTKAAAMAEEHARQIETSGVRVVGQLDHLTARVPAAEHVSLPTSIPIATAAEALVAVCSTGLGRGPSFAPVPSRPPTRPRAEDLPTSAVARLLVRRLRSGLRRRLSRSSGW